MGRKRINQIEKALPRGFLLLPLLLLDDNVIIYNIGKFGEFYLEGFCRFLVRVYGILNLVFSHLTPPLYHYEKFMKWWWGCGRQFYWSFPHW